MKLPIIPAAVNTLRRTATHASYLFLHAIFNHCGDEKLYQTLLHTPGYRAQRFEPQHCNTCAQAKARGFGLRQGTRNAEVDAVVNMVDQLDHEQCCWLMSQLAPLQLESLCMPVSHPIFGDPSDDSELVLDDPAVMDLEYEAPVAGRRLGVQSVPRFQLYTLRPFEVMFVDNKDFPCAITGGCLQAFIFICYKTSMKAKIDINRKTENGKAFLRIVARHGIPKLEYPCRVWSDGCGSMVHVEHSASRVGIDHAYISPHQQSLNEAEKVADLMWAAARAHMLQSQAPEKLFSKAIDFAIYSDMRTATTASRGWLTPYEMVRNTPPVITKMHVFYTRCFVGVPVSKRKALAKRGLHNTRAEPGRFLGFQSPMSTTNAVMLDQVAHNVDRYVHSLHVTFDDTDTSLIPPPAPPGGADALIPVPAAIPQGHQVPAAAEEANIPEASHHNSLYALPQTYVSIPQLPPMPAIPKRG